MLYSGPNGGAPGGPDQACSLSEKFPRLLGPPGEGCMRSGGPSELLLRKHSMAAPTCKSIMASDKDIRWLSA